MNPKSWLVLVSGALALFLAGLWLASASHVGAALDIHLLLYELPLNPNGGAFEINLDPQGHLWLSDYTAGEVWELDPVGRVYTTYQDLGHPGDARLDGAGSVWYADSSGENLGQLSPAAGTLTQWEISGSNGLYATQVDLAGNIWSTSWWDPLLYRFNPTSGQLCTYEVPSNSASQYIETDGQLIYLADYNGEYIFRLDPSQDEYTLWTLPEIGWPVGLDLDQDSNLWWADYDLGTLNHLDVGQGLMTVFTATASSFPVMLDASGEQVQFADDYYALLGTLTPSQAVSDTLPLETSTLPVTPSCGLIEPSPTTPVTVTHGLISYTQTTYTDLVSSAGWQIWQVPGINSAPYGVRVSGKSTWVSDYVRQLLIWHFSGSVVGVCKYADADGDLGTTEDQTPLSDWRVYLVVDGNRQEPGELTRSSGCYTWLDLDTGHTYGVEEQLQPGWTALTPATHDFGSAAEGQLYTYDFTNYRGQRHVYLPLLTKP